MHDMYSISPLKHMELAAGCLKVIAHPIRLQMIEVLLDHRLSVGELAKLTNTPQNVASEHLKRLKDHQLISMERDGRHVYCKVIEPGMRSIIQCIQARYTLPPAPNPETQPTNVV